MTGRHNNPIVVRFGNEILEAGFTTVPNLALNHYAELGITSDEMMFTIHVWQYWWSERTPYPSLATIAAKMGKSWRTVHRYAKSLESKQLLIITHREKEDGGQTTSQYDFEPMINALVQHARTRGPLPSVKTDRGSMTEAADEPLTAVSDEEDQEEIRRRGEPSKRRSISREEREVITTLITDLAREFFDQAPLQSSVTRALNLFRDSELDIADFVSHVYTARARTKEYTGNIRAGEGGRRPKMAYFFSVLQDLIHGAL